MYIYAKIHLNLEKNARKPREMTNHNNPGRKPVNSA